MLPYFKIGKYQPIGKNITTDYLYSQCGVACCRAPRPRQPAIHFLFGKAQEVHELLYRLYPGKWALRRSSTNILANNAI